MIWELLPRKGESALRLQDRRRWWDRWLLPFGLVVLVGLWALLAWRIGRPYLLPSPGSVLESFLQNAGRIGFHARVTLVEVLVGFGLGSGLAFVLGYAVYRNRILDRLIMPYVVASQAIPIVAVAPLLVFWFGTGLLVKIAAAALVVFFPMMVNTVLGLRSIDPELRDLMHINSAGRWQRLVKLEIPAALPSILAGLRVGVTLAVIGAVVGEFLGSDRGLGTLITLAGKNYDDSLMFAALLSLITLALSLYGAAAMLERGLLRNRVKREV